MNSWRVERPAKAFVDPHLRKAIGTWGHRSEVWGGEVGAAGTEWPCRQVGNYRQKRRSRTAANLLSPGLAGANLSATAVRPTLREPIRRVSELASSLTRNQMSSNGLGVRISCPPLLFFAGFCTKPQGSEERAVFAP